MDLLSRKGVITLQNLKNPFFVSHFQLLRFLVKRFFKDPAQKTSGTRYSLSSHCLITFSHNQSVNFCIYEPNFDGIHLAPQ